MKKVFYSVLGVLILNFSNNALGSRFPKIQTRSVILSGAEIFVAETQQKDVLSVNSKTYILKNGNRENLELPDEVKQREILAVFKASPNKVWVVSQWVIEMGDKPLVSELNLKNQNWEELARVDCVAHRSIDLTSEGLKFTCLEDDIIEGKYVEKLKSKTVQLR